MTRRNALLLLAALVVVWGTNWSVVKLIVEEVSPIWSAALRCIIAAVTLFIIQCASRQFIIPPKHDWNIIVVISLFHITSTCFFMAVGLQFIGAGRSAVLGYTTPLWVVPAAWFFLKESVPLMRILGVLVGLCGVVILVNPATLDWNDSLALAGHGLLLGSALCWTVAIISIKAHKWMATPFQLVFWQVLLASILLIVLAFIVEGVPRIALNANLVLMLLYSGIPATALGFWAVTVINRALPATLTSLAMLGTPVVGIIGGILIMGESLDLPLIIATGLILSGIALGVVGDKQS